MKTKNAAIREANRLSLPDCLSLLWLAWAKAWRYLLSLPLRLALQAKSGMDSDIEMPQQGKG